MDIGAYVKQHPVAIGMGVFVLGVGFLLLRGSGGSGGSTDASLGAAYYQALSSQSSNQTALAIAQTQATSSTAQTQIAADTYTSAQNTWAATSLATTQANNSAAVSMAPYATEQELIATLGSVASLPGSTTTKKSNGFFGIGGGVSQTYTPNPAATSAASELSQLLSGFHVGNG